MNNFKRLSHPNPSTWGDDPPESELTPIQKMIHEEYIKLYEQNHPRLSESGEEKLINAYTCRNCPYCGSSDIISRGFTKNHIQRYHCHNCDRAFTPVTGTIFGNHKVAITEWVDFMYDLISYATIEQCSIGGMKTITTSKLWLQKVFLILKIYRTEQITLPGKLTLGNFYYTPERGTSSDRICISVATIRGYSFFVSQGKTNASKRRTLRAFESTYTPKTKIIFQPGIMNNETTEDLSYFLSIHNCQDEKTIQGYLDLFSLINNPPKNKKRKVAFFLDLAFKTRITLRFRDLYSK